MVQAVESNTVFLPFKINASNPSEITKVADQALEHETKAKGHVFCLEMKLKNWSITQDNGPLVSPL